jgi:acyl-CoA reductase-like NAD-dependent aldehyde dehydrogenase
MIPGRKAQADHNLEVTAPFTGEVIGHIAQCDEADIEAALTLADNTFSDRANWLPVAERIAILERAIDLLTQDADALALASALEGGKPLPDSKVEMARCIDSLKSCVEGLRDNTCHPVPMGINAASAHRFTVMKKEPIGVVVAVSAFNHPLNLIAHQVGPAIAVGCPVIVKPAEDTPLSCFRMVEIFRKAGLPEAWCQAVMPLDHSVAEKLVTDPRVSFFSFIGSARVGWYLRSKLAPGTRCALEHGGVAPVIVNNDADLNRAVPSLAKGGFYHAGQVCVSVQRVYAHASIARELAEALAKAGDEMKVGDPTLANTDVGPLIRASEVERVDSWVQAAIQAGTECISGGKPLAHQCYAPTVLFNPREDLQVSRAEVFGPVICVYPFNDVDDAIDRANNLDVSFQASVYSQDIDTAMYVSDRLAASAVMINEHTAFRVDWMPFAGLKHSGLGTGGIPYTMEDMQIEKMIVITSPSIQ